MSGDSNSSINSTPLSKRELLKKLLRAKTAQEQSASFERKTPISTTNATERPIHRVDRSHDSLPLSFAQRRMWVLDQLEPGNPAYNLSVSIRLRGHLRMDALTNSVAEIIRRHETLRTTFIMMDDEPAQVIHAPFTLPVPIVIIQPEQEPELPRLIHEETSQLFDLSKMPPVRAKLLKLDDTDHVLVFTFHHIISDGWSLQVFIRELRSLYQSFVNKQTPLLPDLPVQYVDFVHWQDEWLQGDALDSQLSYWKEQLAAPLPMLNLPADYARPKVQTFHGARTSLTLSEPLSSALKELSRQESSTLFMTLLAAFSVLLYRQTGQTDMVIGTPIAGRSRSELERLIGVFLNTLVIRVDLNRDPTFLELVRRVRKVALQAYANQDIPFEKLLEELHPERYLNRTPIFQVFFNMLNFNEETLGFADLKSDYVDQSDAEARFDLTLYAREEHKCINLIFVYNTDLFSHERMEEMAGQLEGLLKQIAASPDETIDRYSLITDRARLMLPDPAALLDRPEQIFLPRWVSDWARRTPNAIAIEKDAHCWTYKELDIQARLLARRLVRMGVKSGDVVAVCGSRSFNLIASMLAVFVSGGVLLTIDDDLPIQRKQLMLREASAKALIRGGGETEARIVWADMIQEDMILRLTDSPKDLAASEVEDEATDIQPALSGDAPAYIFFTSGTTGTPKGVRGNHNGLSHFLVWQRNTFDVQSSDRAAQLTALSFDVVLRDIFLVLVSGATLCLPEDNIELDAEATLKWLGRNRISIIHTVPALAQMWLGGHAAESYLPELRWVFFAGEPLKDSLVHQWRKYFPECQIVNLYGPTETTMAKCFYQIPSQIHQGIQPVGAPLPQTQALIINKAGRLCGIGEVGEIVIRTPFRTLGYINAPEENARKFFRNPFRDDEHDLVYHTGDQGRYRLDGYLDILGRIDDQVKIRGNRIELSEIESALCQHPDVKQAVVSLWEDETGDKRLAAYIVPVDLQFPKRHELKGYLQQLLPPYMLPASYILVDAIPLTSNGKINRRALPDPDFQSGQDFYIAPQSQLQELLVGIWSDVLHLEKVGIHESFFDLGGHSLLATQIMSRIRQVTRVDLPLRVLFEFPTVAGLSAQVEALKDQDEFDIPPLKPMTRDGYPRLSFSQERMWFVQQLVPETTAYNITGNVSIKGRLNPQALEQAFNMVIDRHEILRTIFDIVDDEPVQVIKTSSHLSMPVINLEAVSDLERTARLDELLTSAAKEPFNLVHGPLIRAFIVRLSDDEHILSIAMHHIISDQWSMGVFSREVASIYNSLTNRLPLDLPDLPLQYADYSLWQRSWLQGEQLNARLAYWRKQLDGITALDLPTDHPRPAMQSFNGAMERIDLPESLIESVNNLCRQERITPFMFFLAIFKILLIRYSGQKDVAVGTPIANRNWLETENLMGTFVNTVVLRTQLVDNPMFKEFLRSIRELSLDAFGQQDFPFEKLVQELQSERDMSRSPLIQVMFNMLNAPTVTQQPFNDLSMSPIWVDRRTAQFDLTFSVSVDVFPHMLLFYNTDLFEQGTAQRMLGHLKTLMEHALEDPDRRILDLPMLTSAEQEKQLRSWNDTCLEYSRVTCVHELIEAQVERTPEAVAIVFNSQQMTYRELNERANQLARHLRSLGVSSETPVGISAERSAEMIVGLLAILKAGGAYIPLDPHFPQERIEYMLGASETHILLAQKGVYTAKDDTQRVIYLDGDWDAISRNSSDNLSVKTQPENLAYILFTSGSTGKPKGVQIPHRAVANFLASMRQIPGMKDSDRLLAVTTLSFDISVLEVFLPLTTGACVVVAPGEEIYDGAALIRRLSTGGITVMQATPATWQMLIEAGWQGDKNLKVLCGGEAMSKDLAAWLTSHAGSVWNMYGPTETTVWSTLCEITATTQVITIGHPIANTKIYILDDNLEPAPIGVAGELYIAGDGVARGYLNQPDLTAERFLSDPFDNAPGARMYKTGDQARYLANGQIDFLGRADFQVKIRGFRIELGEIEAVLNSHPNIRQAVVVAREDNPGDKRLAAYLISQAEYRPDIGELRQFIKLKLPEYMIPSSFMFLEEFPMTPNRKVNRKSLPAPVIHQGASKRSLMLPRNEVEKAIADLWASVLGISDLDIYDNFFDLGGHSLLATRVIARIRDRYQIDLPLRVIFVTPTIAEIAEAVSTILWATQGSLNTPNMISGNQEEIEL
ncbi:MAG: amino acid adenylation domain-containing protein [Anaerolineales bacterium]|nr:amino acid adenylation domain-containing protein [Anaerolineales bacterium]